MTAPFVTTPGPISSRNGTVCRYGDCRSRSFAFWPHCAACHKDFHSACQTCERCLDPTATGKWKDGEGGPRRDALYCSPACRQKAYRTRMVGTA
jgi:hypothetical protein